MFSIIEKQQSFPRSKWYHEWCLVKSVDPWPLDSIRVKYNSKYGANVLGANYVKTEEEEE